MLRILKFEFRRMLNSKSLYFSLLIALVIVSADAHSKYELVKQGYDTQLSVFVKWIGTFRWFEESIYLFSLLPLLTSFVHSWTVAYDRSSGYITQIVTRTSRKKYFFAKYIASFVSGGIVFVFSVIAHFMIISTFFSATVPIQASATSSVIPYSFGSELFYTQLYLFMLAWTGMAFLWGRAMASIAVGAGMITQKYSISVITPFLVFTIQQIIGTYIYLRFNILICGHTMGIIWSEMLYAAPVTTNYQSHLMMNIAAVTIIPSVIYAIRGRKYECL